MSKAAQVLFSHWVQFSRQMGGRCMGFMSSGGQRTSTIFRCLIATCTLVARITRFGYPVPWTGNILELYVFLLMLESDVIIEHVCLPMLQSYSCARAFRATSDLYKPIFRCPLGIDLRLSTYHLFLNPPGSQFNDLPLTTGGSGFNNSSNHNNWNLLWTSLVGIPSKVGVIPPGSSPKRILVFPISNFQHLLHLHSSHKSFSTLLNNAGAGSIVAEKGGRSSGSHQERGGRERTREILENAPSTAVKDK